MPAGTPRSFAAWNETPARGSRVAESWCGPWKPRVARGSRRRVGLSVLAVAAVGLAILLVPGLVRRHLAEPRAASAFQPRNSLAVAELTVDGDIGAQSWVGPTLAALVELELAAAETSLRTVPLDDVVLAKRSLGLVNPGRLSTDDCHRLRTLLGVSTLIVGTVQPSTRVRGQLEVSLTADPESSGHAVEAISETFAPEDLLAASSRLGERLRGALGASLSEKEKTSLGALRPRFAPAARAYADGLSRLGQSDYPGALQSLSGAASTDGSFHLAHLEAAKVWLLIGNRREARAAAQLAVDTARQLPTSAQLRAEYVLRMANDDSAGAMRVGAHLFDAFPDDPGLVEALMETTTSAEAGMLILNRWRAATPSSVMNLHLQVWEGWWAFLSDRAKASEVFEGLEHQAGALGARIELGDGLLERAIRLAASEEPAATAMSFDLAERAEAAYHSAGYLEGIARAQLFRARTMGNPGSPKRAPLPQILAEYRNALANWRRLGLTGRVNQILLDIAGATYTNDLAGAQAIVKEVQDSLASVEEPEPLELLFLRSWIGWRTGDLIGARRAINEGRGRLGGQLHAGKGDWAFVEGLVLTEEDRLPEARALFERNSQTQQSHGFEDSALRNQGFACLDLCHEGQTGRGLACLDQLRSSIRASKVATPGAGFTVRRVHTECLVTAKRFAEAEASLGDWGPVVVPPFPATFNVLKARVEAARGREAAALSRLQATAAEAERKHWALQRLEAELALGEVEIRRSRDRGRSRLTKLQAEANRMGFLRIARLAREVVGEESP